MTLWKKGGICAVALLFLPFTGCGGASGPEPGELNLTVEEVAGDYHATTFVVEDNETAEVTDLLAQGADLRIDFRADGQLVGEVFIPAFLRPFSEQNEEDLEESFSGSWTLRSDDGHIEITLDKRLFLDDLPFSTTREDPLIVGGEVFEDVTIKIILARS